MMEEEKEKEQEKGKLEVGIIGMGLIGRMLLTRFARAGYSVNVCDLPSQHDVLAREFADQAPAVRVFQDGHGVSRRSDYVIYCVEAENIDRVVQAYGPSTKLGAVVGGQTSVKEPEMNAFEKYLPDDVQIVSCHSMHAPTVDPKGQPLVVIRHRCYDDRRYQQVLAVLRVLDSDIVELHDFKEHDQITADTQAVTHLAFMSMGAAWKGASIYPWENKTYVGGIDNVKVLMALRIFNSKPHVYAGLAILNPSAKRQIRQYVLSVSELFRLMIQENESEFRSRIKKAGEFVFGQKKTEIMLPDHILEEYSLGIIPGRERKPNSHLSLLAMVDCWHELKVNPYDHMICQTPPFRLLLGIAEYLFRSEELLNETLEAAIYDKEMRGDDMQFYAAVREWATVISHNDFSGYKERFSEIQTFFGGRCQEATKASSELIRKITDHHRLGKMEGKEKKV